MLQTYKVESPQDRSALLATFDPAQTTWVVSDLRSKFEIQNHLMQKQGFFEDHSVLRASELWKLILRRSHPDFQIVPRDFLKSYLREKLKDGFKAEDLGSDVEEETLLSFVDLSMQVISHPEGAVQLEAWLEENQVASKKWGRWSQFAISAGTQILQSQKMSARWVAAFLTNQVGWEKHWTRPLIVDVGAELTRAEADVLRTLSAHVAVTVLQPQIADHSGYRYLLQPYEEIAGFAQSQTSAPKKKIGPPDHPPEFVRLTGPLAEVKFAVQKTREWLEAGAAPKNVAIIAADIESYWPWLEIYLKQEGIPVAKETTIRLQSLPYITWWLSRLRVATKNFQYADLESSAFADSSRALPLRFEKFSSLFKNLLGVEDLARDPTIFKNFSQDLIPGEPMGTKAFFVWLAKFWPDGAPVLQLELILKEILQVNDPSLTLKFSTWVYWLEHIAGKMEITLDPADREGVQVIALASADSPSFTNRIFLGVTESAFRPRGTTLISSQESKKYFAIPVSNFPIQKNPLCNSSLNGSRNFRPRISTVTR